MWKHSNWCVNSKEKWTTFLSFDIEMVRLTSSISIAKHAFSFFIPPTRWEIWVSLVLIIFVIFYSIYRLYCVLYMPFFLRYEHSPSPKVTHGRYFPATNIYCSIKKYSPWYMTSRSHVGWLWFSILIILNAFQVSICLLL